MAAYKFTSHRQLRNLLNDAEVKQKNDIKDFAGGHLNESLLHKPRSEWGSAKWTAGKDSKSRPSTRTTHTTHKTQTTHTSDSSGDDAERKKLKNVLNVLYDFSVGTSGSVPLPEKKRSDELLSKKKLQHQQSEQDSRPVSTRKDISPVSRKSIYSELNDGVLVEELKAEEMMIPREVFAHLAKKQPLSEDYNVMEELSERLDRDGLMTFRHSFLPTYHTGVTKKDQFCKMKQFESGILRKQDSEEQNVLTGIKAVAHLEKRLEEVSRFLIPIGRKFNHDFGSKLINMIFF